MYMATASEHGTIIRVHLVSDASKSYSFRRGTYVSTIFSLSFGPSLQLPDILVASSSSGSVHIFFPGIAVNQRSKRSNSFLGAVLGSVNDVLDPAHHLVLHGATPVGVKSYAVIRKVDKDPKTSASEFTACRAIISIITFNGYFQEYNLSINEQNEASWSLEREFNLLMLNSMP
ncbi:uncharacterized protein J3R85_010773 [Psidium guajava]|nr:uncharacterized protein J3R85_010773 [Psidium guajava]